MALEIILWPRLDVAVVTIIAHSYTKTIQKPIKDIPMNIQIHGKIVKENKTAYYISDWKGVERSIPKSQVKAVTRRGQGGKYYNFMVSESFAIQKGFI